MSNEEHVLDLIPAYALGALDRNDAREVEAHLPGCVECQAELQRMEVIAHDLPLALAPVDPPQDLRQRLQDRISPAAGVAPAAEGASLWQQINDFWRQHRAIALTQAALVALVLVLLASTILLWQQVNELQPGPRQGSLQAVRLDSTGEIANAEGYLTVSWNGMSGALILDQVPQLEEGQAYQLWLVRDGQRESGALLQVDALGYGGGRVQPPQSLFNYDAAEVTIEPAEGSSQPTSAVILRAELFP